MSRHAFCTLETLEDRRLLAITPVINALDFGTSGAITIKAGQSLHVDATASTFDGAVQDKVKHRIEWDFGDYSNPATQTPNSGAKYITLPGFSAAHVYDTPSPTGQPYVVRLTITGPDGQTEQTLTRNVTVVANERDQAANTIYVKSNGSDTGNGTLAQPVSWSRMITLLRGSSFGDDTTVKFFKGDELWATTDGTSTGAFQQVLLKSSGSGLPDLKNVAFTDYDDGTGQTAKPVIQYPPSMDQTDSGTGGLISTNSGVRNISIRNIEIRTGDGDYKGRVFTPMGRNFVAANVTFNKIYSAFQGSAATLFGFLVQDCDTGTKTVSGQQVPGDVGNYFVYTDGGSSDLVLLGNRGGDSPNNHNMRTNGDRLLAYANEFRNVGGQDHAATLRANVGHYIHFEKNVLRGGQLHIGKFGSDQTGYVPMRHVVVENNRQFDDPEEVIEIQRWRVQDDVAYVMFRNNYVEASPPGLVAIETTANYSYLYNNTLVLDPGEVGFRIKSTATNSVIQNNLVIGPSGAIVVELGQSPGWLPASHIAKVSNNIWPTGSVFRYLAGDNNHNLGEWTAATAGGSGPNGEAEDIERTVTLDGELRPDNAEHGMVLEGVFTDLYDSPRPATAPWTAGAVELAASDTVAPATPTGLSATGNSANISLDWANNSESDLAGYHVYRSDTTTGFYAQLTTAPITTSAYVDNTVPAGATKYYKVTAIDGSGNQSAQTAAVSATRAGTQTPFSGAPFVVGTTPVTIEAEHFDVGGEEIAYHDSTAGNTGESPNPPTFRTGEDVDIKPTSDGGPNSYRVNGTQAGEWLEYTIDVQQAGSYTLDTRVAAFDPNAKFHVEVDGFNATGTIDVPDTNNYNAMQTVSRTIDLTGGAHVLRLVFDTNTSTDSDAGTINWMKLTAQQYRESSGRLVIRGTGGNDAISIAPNGANTNVTINGNTESYATSSLTGVLLDIANLGGADAMTVNAPAALPVTLAGSASGDTLTANGGTVTLDGTEHLDAVTINAGATVQMLANGFQYLFTKGLSIAPGGQLDLFDNDLIWDYTGADVYQNVFDWVNEGIDTGNSGLTSTTAEGAGDTVLAPANSGAFGVTSWLGQSIDDTTLIIKYTYYGDGNLDGQVTTDDNVPIDLNLGTGTTWIEGDYNLDRQVTTDDYIVVDLNLGKGEGNPL